MSNIATTIEQSFRMMKNGVDPMTADMYYEDDNHLIVARDEYDLEIAVKYRKLMPAWSFSKLYDMVALNASEFAIINDSKDYIEYLVKQAIEEWVGREKLKQRLKEKNKEYGIEK